MYGLLNAEKKDRAAGALSREQAEWRAVIVSSPRGREASADFQKVPMSRNLSQAARHQAAGSGELRARVWVAQCGWQAFCDSVTVRRVRVAAEILTERVIPCRLIFGQLSHCRCGRHRAELQTTATLNTTSRRQHGQDPDWSSRIGVAGSCLQQHIALLSLLHR